MSLATPELVGIPARIARRIDFDGPIPPDPAIPIETGCWIWTGGKFPAGYGSCWLDKRNRLVHQVIFGAVKGETSDRQAFLDHLCRVRECCNPEHLKLGTPLDNMLSAQRDHCMNGHEYTPENTGNTSLSPHQRVCRACSRERTARYRARKAKNK